MASIEDWNLGRFREVLRRRAARLRCDPRVLVRFDESDLVQDALLRAAEARAGPTGETDEERLAWLSAILDNLLIDRHREHFAKKRDVRREQHLDALRQALQESSAEVVGLLPDSSPSPSENAARGELEARVAAAIDQLPPRQRDVLLLRKEGRTFEEIARQLGITKGAAQGVYNQGLKRLRELMPKAES